MTGADWFLKAPNKLGFRVDIAHPEIRDLYRAYKKRIGAAVCDPISDRERLDFEAEIFAKFFQLNKEELLANGAGRIKKIRMV